MYIRYVMANRSIDEESTTGNKDRIHCQHQLGVAFFAQLIIGNAIKKLIKTKAETKIRSLSKL